MSNGEVKRWDIYFCSDDSNLLDDVAIEVDEEVRTARDGERRIEVMPVKDHERIVAEKDAEIAKIGTRRFELLDSANKWAARAAEAEKTIATQKRVIEKLSAIIKKMECNKTFHSLGGIDDCDPCLLKRELAAIEKGV